MTEVVSRSPRSLFSEFTQSVAATLHDPSRCAHLLLRTQIVGYQPGAVRYLSQEHGITYSNLEAPHLFLRQHEADRVFDRNKLERQHDDLRY